MVAAITACLLRLSASCRLAKVRAGARRRVGCGKGAGWGSEEGWVLGLRGKGEGEGQG